MQGAPSALPGLQTALQRQALEARTCLPRKIGEVSLPRLLMWSAKPARKSLSFSWAPDPERGETMAPAAVAACIERKLRPPPWKRVATGTEEDPDGEAGSGEEELLGMARLDIRPAGSVS